MTLKGIKSKSAEERALIQECIKIIHENISDEEFTIDHLANKIGYSRSKLYRKIKDITHLTAIDFVKKIKLQYAVKLLLNDPLTVSQVAWKIGYSDPKYFSKVFIHEYGIKPSKLIEMKKL